MAAQPNLTAAAIALNRFGLGARPDDKAPADPKAWLLAQLDQYQPKPAAWASQPDALTISSELEQQRMQLRLQTQRNPGGASMPAQTNAQTGEQAASQSDTRKDKEAERKAIRAEIRDNYRSSVNARVTSALTTQTPFVERLVHFWANHFAVSAENPLWRRSPAHSKPKRSAHMCWAVSRTCWSRWNVIRPCNCFSIRRAR